jgi:hypothetical protein
MEKTASIWEDLASTIIHRNTEPLTALCLHCMGADLFPPE